MYYSWKLKLLDKIKEKHKKVEMNSECAEEVNSVIEDWYYFDKESIGKTK